ncbi:hypothetical protein GCM10010517_82020 [Streptosporangium fragile]|uniref:Uncharacterized protein n=1 Tax=Streptosporangium fragile TaxID=46186 RepID=A0ABP6J1J7_9ACTN
MAPHPDGRLPAGPAGPSLTGPAPDPGRACRTIGEGIARGETGPAAARPMIYKPIVSAAL